MEILETPSPNFDDRGRDVDTVIVHYTGMVSGTAALERLCEPAAKVSAHYLVEEDGRVYQLVPEEKRAWHAGVSSWRGEADTNARSIGIEIVNPGHEFGYRDFPDAQIASVIGLLRAIKGRHNIAPARVLGHSDVAPNRKEDPGELFPWGRLAKEGLALAPFSGEADVSIAYEDALTALGNIGYDLSSGGHAAPLLAFQRRFCPEALGQGFNPLTKAALLSIAKISAK